MAVNMYYSVTDKHFVSRLFHLLAKEKGPLQGVEMAKLLIAFGRNKQAPMKLKLALMDAPDRMEIGESIDVSNKSLGRK